MFSKRVWHSVGFITNSILKKMKPFLYTYLFQILNQCLYFYRDSVHNLLHRCIKSDRNLFILLLTSAGAVERRAEIGQAEILMSGRA